MTAELTFTLGERLAKARRHVGLEQEQMAMRLAAYGIKAGRTTVGAWEAERNQPRDYRKVLDAWAEITGVSVAWLLDLGEHGSSWNDVPLPFDDSLLPSGTVAV